MKSRLKPVLDRQLSQLDWSPEETQALLRQMRGEIPVKKKLSLALALTLALALLAVTALAVTLWKSYHEQIARNEGSIGYFDTWTGQQRADFVLAMQREGLSFDPEQIRLLEDRSTSDEQKKEIATRLVTEKYGIREDVVTAISILESEYGPLPGWSLERKAAYTQLLKETGTLGADEEMYWLPGDQDIPEKQAAETARRAVGDKFGARKEELDGLRLILELRSFADAPEARQWYAGFYREGADFYSEPAVYDVWMDAKTGEVQSCEAPANQAKEAGPKTPPPEAEKLLREMRKALYEQFPYTCEKLMELQKTWLIHLETLKSYGLLDEGGDMRAITNLTAQALRLPEEGDLPLEAARQKVREAILTLPGWSKKALDMYDLYAEALYESKQLGKPVYQFIFWRQNSSSPKWMEKPWEAYEQEYLTPLYALFGGIHSTPLTLSLRLDAKTGELTEPPVQVLPDTKGQPLPFDLFK